MGLVAERAEATGKNENVRACVATMNENKGHYANEESGGWQRGEEREGLDSR